MRRHAGAAMAVGSLLFLIAAFSPISNRVFVERSPMRREAFLRRAPRQWLVAQALFASGSLLTAAGLVAHAFGERPRRPVALRAGAATFAASALLWSAAVLVRTLRPLRFARGELAGWPSYASFLGAETGLAVVGLGLQQPEWPRWSRRTVTGVGAGLAVLTLFFGDMPPFVFYLVTLPLGLAVQRRRTGGAGGVRHVPGVRRPRGGDAVHSPVAGSPTSASRRSR